MRSAAAQPASPLLAPVAVALGAAAAGAALVVRSPHVPGTWAFCPFLVLTGHPCPLCGGLRAVHDVLTGDVPGAVSQNAVVTAALPLAAVLWVVWVVRRLQGRTDGPAVPATARAWLVLALVAFGAFRLTPWGAWFAPS
jgi:hypothetical protein